MAKLIVKFKDKTLKEIVLKDEVPVTIGRDKSNDLQLDNPAVSRFHAKVYKHCWPFYVEDLESTNGTVLNGKKLSWKSALSDKDVITIGKHSLVFVDDRSQENGRLSAAGADKTICITKKS